MARPPPTGDGGAIELLNIAGASESAGVAWQSIDDDAPSRPSAQSKAAAATDFALPTSVRASAFSISATIPLPFDSVDELASVAAEQMAEITSSLSIEQLRVIRFLSRYGLLSIFTLFCDLN